jgi:hypothetical protein
MPIDISAEAEIDLSTARGYNKASNLINLSLYIYIYLAANIFETRYSRGALQSQTSLVYSSILPLSEYCTIITLGPSLVPGLPISCDCHINFQAMSLVTFQKEFQKQQLAPVFKPKIGFVAGHMSQTLDYV